MIIIANTILFILTVRRFNLVKSAVKQTRKSSVSAKGESYEYSENKAMYKKTSIIFVLPGKNQSFVAPQIHHKHQTIHSNGGSLDMRSALIILP